LEDDIIDLVYFARISWEDAWSLSLLQRNKIVKRINKHRRDESGGPEQLGE